jgi:O-6-methylguanine DNA methyltransferase
MRIKITSDSTCDLSREQIARYDIEIMPLAVAMGGNNYRDGVDIAPSDIYSHVDKGGDLPKTAANNIADYAEVFAKYSKEYDAVIHLNISAETVGFDYIWSLRKSSRWEDFMLFGTAFQKKVWQKLYELTHVQDNCGEQKAILLSYTDFAELCENRAGVRAVAHAVGLNPLAVLIPCHLVVPKETIDRIREIQKKAESTIFKGDDLCINSLLREKGIDFGEYSLGRSIKKELIQLEHSQQ